VLGSRRFGPGVLGSRDGSVLGSRDGFGTRVGLLGRVGLRFGVDGVRFGDRRRRGVGALVVCRVISVGAVDFHALAYFI